jgi:hypothetical protein
VSLPFKFPFYGRTVTTLSVSTSGALLLGDRRNALQLPSHIAVLFSMLPPGEEPVLVDLGKRTYLNIRSPRLY